MDKNYKLTEEQVQQILDTPVTKIEISDVFNTIHLSREERNRHARRILDSRKMKRERGEE
ncbi:hypothetical protein [Rossellomorea sp. BNER]|uniref:hypothetical protein n=1 Tax=Rossellomorea sp. BNER TaxID=2962031 RepID=UPI003AF2B11B|nr:hypothetical protein [Rossellomorea sp. BNER]